MPDTGTGLPSGKVPVPQEFLAGVADILDSFVSAQRTHLAPLGADVDPLFDVADAALAGGKRLRAAFVYWGWRAAGGSATKTTEVLRVAAAVELVHASALVHDDVVDASATRRGRPAAHQAFAARVPTAVPGTAERFGTAAAIMLGDLLLAWSDELFAESGFKPKAIARGRVFFDKLRREVVAGQYLDILAQTRRRSSASEAMRVLLYKSAKYTVERPLQLGAALGKGNDRLLAALSSYGVPVGEAFQLRDDVLGVFGASDLTGKPSGDDIREGKRTLLMARAFDRADANQRAVLERCLGRADLDAADVVAVQAVLRDSGAVASVEIVINELTAAALAALRHAPLEDEEARTALRTLSDQAANRSS